MISEELESKEEKKYLLVSFYGNLVVKYMD